ncbi:hypothetical protein LPJ78_000007 [Coemansia sp. RSA 989]|nr:hypothetical protein BX667DRAFT_514849 [Coemansia mojavensis]KAJ1753684.1 hypothetical protein LPJ79_000277 [Coemansia sp. RSA 1821]KAJ1868495.1 hypothetical protein LPJ78_000007 [Coemansia sp. RSA 989]KAJ1876105.1 hypothetical protein LPJ55_000007 [Coemansia sp. RSA 990]KAJ2629657.1 hypothetical protein H4R22_003196 [Coemansia sp. RSA 1290]KAJ2652384.1 hypothetical protein IWW40_001239 [Coemansia sp. RSA 1250]
MVKERSYKILEQLDEYELQEPGSSHVAVYSNEDEQLTHEQRANAVPSAVDDSDDEADESVAEFHEAQSNPTHEQQPGSVTMPNPTDGVFANMSAKPDLHMDYGDKDTNEPLPTYQDIYGPQSSAAPPYFEAAVISVGDEDELLVEGMPVGSIGVFLVNMVVSTAFQIVGYMLTFLLHTSHAARNGSLAGLGITFMNFGFYIRTHLGQPLEIPDDHKGPMHQDPDYDTDTPLDNKYFAYLLLVIGAGIFIKAVFDYIRVRRLQTIIESSPEQNV